MARQEGGQCSIAAMRHPLAWALGGFALFGFLRRRREASPSSVDPRAEELRRKLAESRAIVEERDEFEGAELTVEAESHLRIRPEDAILSIGCGNGELECYLAQKYGCAIDGVDVDAASIRSAAEKQRQGGAA